MIEETYLRLARGSRTLRSALAPHMRRFLRFLALPYCYFSLVDWRACPVSRLRVAWDFLYIFFRLKHFPDNYSMSRLWEKSRSEWRLYYGSIYDAHQRARLRKEVQREEYSIVFDDKFLCHQVCQAGGLPVPRHLAYIRPDQDAPRILQDLLEPERDAQLVVKPARGKGGRGVLVVMREEERAVYRERGETRALSGLRFSEPVVVQTRIPQHPDLGRVSPSINTCRILTLWRRDGTILVIGALVRFGLGTALVDNRSAGGVAAPIALQTGRISGQAWDFRGVTYDRHPTTGVVFEGVELPEWSRALELAEASQRLFPYYRLLGHDIGFTEDGPILIEVNASPDIAGFEQVCGPILAVPEVRQAFREYDLLVTDLPLS